MQRMDTILFLTHVEPDGTIPRAALETLTAVQSVSEALGTAGFMAGLVGSASVAAAGRLASSGATKVMAVTSPEVDQSRYATDAGAAEAICRASGATIVMAPAVSRWARALPGVAFRIRGRIDTHVTSVAQTDAGVSVSRWYYRQRMEAVVRRTTRPWIILIDPGCYPPWAGAPGDVAVDQLAIDWPASVTRTSVVDIVAPPADQQTIRPDAALLFVAGAGWTKKQADDATHPEEAEGLILEFLRRTQASLGGSKSLVELSGEGHAVLRFMSHLNQIGQTGSSPRHQQGLSTCCHGEEPHVVGWRFVTERRAVNLDPNCGWARGKADVLYVADAFDVIAKVNALLAERKP